MRLPSPRSLSRTAIAAALWIPFFTAPDNAGAQSRSGESSADRERDRDRDRIVRIERLPSGLSVDWGNMGNRAVLGVALADAGKGERDGVRIASVNPDGPASNAGLKAGDVITAINGTSLQVSAADADDPALTGLAARRLSRVLAKAKPGDVVDLRVGTGNASRTVSVTTVSASALASAGTPRVLARTSRDGDARDDARNETRGVIGLAIGGSGSVRDTLGLFVSSVVANGPAEKAGVIEGERIAAVNGVDVRVPREDVEDGNASSARASRFLREVGKVAPGGTVTLRVFSGGRYREVTVTAVQRSALPSQGFRMSIGDDAFSMTLPNVEMRRSMEDLRQQLQRLGPELRETIQGKNWK